MGREIRRVPLGWEHPTEPNPYWLEQTASRLYRDRTLSLLHMPQVRFVGLMEDYPTRLAEWEQETRDIAKREGRDWAWNIEYHLTGYKGSDDETEVVHPFYVWENDAEVEVSVRDEDHLHELMTAQKADEKPDPADYLPVFDVPADELGWCLYETVSEGTPVSPVFATADELIEHLATHGQDWAQKPMRREAAEALVRGGWAPSGFAIGGTFYKGDEDIDVLQGASA
jgi:hypothetical protein